MTTITASTTFEVPSHIIDAPTFLSGGYQELFNLFEMYKHSKSIVEKQKISEKICTTLMINMQLEEEIFHPVMQIALKEKGMISSAAMNHNILRYLVSEIESMDVDSDIYDIKISILAEHVKEYIKEKQSKLFPKVASTKIDLWGLGAQLALRKEELFSKNIH